LQDFVHKDITEILKSKDRGNSAKTRLLRDMEDSMKTSRTGIILNTQNFEACREFYKDILGLEELFSKNENGHKLSCLEFGGAYLMVETGGYANPEGKSVKESPAKLRFNVPSLEDAQRFLNARGIDARISRFDWGSTINIFDPDGNRIGIREESEFVAQIGERS
jgi:lactoylglutathione lyase